MPAVVPSTASSLLSPCCDEAFSSAVRQHNCSLSRLLDVTQSSSRYYLVISTRCGWSQRATERRDHSLDPCSDIGSFFDVELVPTLLLAASFTW